MSITRQRAIESAAKHRPSDTPPLKPSDIKEMFGCNTFSWDEMQRRLPKGIYEVLMRTVDRGYTLDLSVADVVATAMRDWAMERGATHYAHVFYPLTGSTAEKHDSFMDPDGRGHLLPEFSGRQLIKGEPDASSLPNGGIRSTFEARGYTAWDVTSPAYLIESQNGKTLCIPTAFCSWTGDALDKKVPLLRSMQAVNKQAKRVLKLFGVEETGMVTTSIGPEQEYFLIDRSFYFARPDLINAGRTLFGARPPKGQELEDQYFGTIPERVLAYMMDVESELYKLGVPVKTRHNEVAPGQYEVAPVFETSNLATDHQYLTMQTLQRLAPKYGLVCLLHEKPFAGMNGSGKHVNWSICSPKAGNLLSPGDTPQENMQFLLFCVAVIRAVAKNPVLLRVAVASSGNDHRLGSNEAPPAIMSIFLGEQLTEVLESIAKGTSSKSVGRKTLSIGVDTLPPLPQDSTDRNRTSPFAFTGNRFEFRAVGSSQSIASAQIMINACVADSLDYIATELEAATGGNPAKLNAAVQKLLRDIYRENSSIIFNGDNYTEEWKAEAARRGLPCYPTTVEALEALRVSEKAEMLARQGILTEREFSSRLEIYAEKYVKDLIIEGRLALSMTKTMIYPAGVRYQKLLAETANLVHSLGKPVSTTALDELIVIMGNLQASILRLEAALTSITSDTTLGRARQAKDNIIPAMDALRRDADSLESVVADDLWPLPTYQEMLFIR